MSTSLSENKKTFYIRKFYNWKLTLYDSMWCEPEIVTIIFGDDWMNGDVQAEYS